MDPEDIFLRFDEWAGKVQERLDDHRESVEAISALMVVAAFIAGVQAQIISFTLPLPASALGKAANFFAFLGLVLEVSGTFLGAIHTLFLQRKIKDVALKVGALTQCKADLKIVIKAVKKKVVENQKEEKQGDQWNIVLHGTGNVVQVNDYTVTHIPGLNEVNDYEERAQNLANVLEGMDSRYKALAPPHILETILELVANVLEKSNEAKLLRQDTKLTIVQVKPMMRFMVTYGNVPLVSMAAGVVCLALSTMLLCAASSLGSEVWITCLAALLGVMMLSFLPTSSFIFKLFAAKPSKHAVQSTRNQIHNLV